MLSYPLCATSSKKNPQQNPNYLAQVKYNVWVGMRIVVLELEEG